MPDSPSETTPHLYLTATGRKSGLPRQIEIWLAAHAGAHHTISGGREASDWVKNIHANPAITVSVGSREALAWAGVGRVVR